MTRDMEPYVDWDSLPDLLQEIKKDREANVTIIDLYYGLNIDTPKLQENFWYLVHEILVQPDSEALEEEG